LPMAATEGPKSGGISAAEWKTGMVGWFKELHPC